AMRRRADLGVTADEEKHEDAHPITRVSRTRCSASAPALSGAPLIRDRKTDNVCNGPGSAVHHCPHPSPPPHAGEGKVGVLHCARDTTHQPHATFSFLLTLFATVAAIWCGIRP